MEEEKENTKNNTDANKDANMNNIKKEIWVLVKALAETIKSIFWSRMVDLKFKK
eukprot:gene1352-4528_t